MHIDIVDLVWFSAILLKRLELVRVNRLYVH